MQLSLKIFNSDLISLSGLVPLGLLRLFLQRVKKCLIVKMKITKQKNIESDKVKK